MVTDMMPSRGKGVRVGAFGRCGVSAMLVVEVLLGIGGCGNNRGRYEHRHPEK